MIQAHVDLWAGSAAAVAAAALALRANMLKPSFATWSHAPPPVLVSIMALAIALAMGSITIGSGSHASEREALVYTILAVGAVVMLWNLHSTQTAHDAG